MSTNPNKRVRAAENEGAHSKFHGEFRMAAQSGLVTVAAAASSTAGHMFVMRNPSTTKKFQLRYLAATFATTTAMAAQQPMGYDLIVGRAYTASHTGGTAIDMFTATGSNKVRTNQDLTLFTTNTVRIATTAGLTAGTHTLDGQAISQKMFLSPTLGNVAEVVLFDARDDGDGAVRSTLSLGQDEGIIVRNSVLMGATGVGYLVINVEWDEITL